MALPSIARTWQFRVNQTIAGNAVAATQMANLLLAAKSSMLGVGTWTDKDGNTVTSTGNWTVVGSSNSSTSNMTGTDLWASASDIVNAGSGPHSWIVLQQTGIATKFQVLIDMLNGAGNLSQCAVRVSHTGFGAANGGTDGSTSLSPTALNSVSVTTSLPWGGCANANTPTVLHVLKSADGQATRVVMCRSSFVVAEWFFEKPGNALAAWTNPYVVHVAGSATQAPSVDVSVFNSVCISNATSPLWFLGVQNAGTALLLGPATTGFDGIGALSSAAAPRIYTSSGALTAGYGFFEMLLLGLSAGTLEPSLGIIADMWYGLTAQSTGSGYPSSAVDAVHPRQFVKFGPYIMPWNNSVVVIA